ncbi:spermidine synthase [Caldichromatium japonicum]|uniref:Spermidine synthase n=1 Tax=Caldichromatium japonicum TaxID=2699430 RepID=A0A6G7VF31_9GAMM|nr:spermidine synthase [Caldichromatium japonicum]QIK38631.1 spermidine synthase [Caldichromatium japonicum]
MRIQDRLTPIMLALLVWGFAGALFGALFTGLHRILLVGGLHAWLALIAATTAAAMTTTAFYSAMPIALVGSMAGVLTSIGYLIISGYEIELLKLAELAGGIGLLAGGFYAWIIPGGSRPLAETIAGLIAGVLAGFILSLIVHLIDLGVFVLAAGVVALVGTLFELLDQAVIGWGRRWLPGLISAPLVAGLIAAIVGGGIWLLSGSAASGLDTRTETAIALVLADIPPGLLGGLCGGAITSVILELFGFHLEDQI